MPGALPRCVWCVAHSGPGYSGVRTEHGTSEQEVSMTAGGIFAALLQDCGWTCDIVAGIQSQSCAKANELRKGYEGVPAIELHMNAVPPKADLEHWKFGHLLQHHTGVHAEKELARSINTALGIVMPWSDLIDIIEQPDPNYPNMAFLRGVSSPAVLVEAGFVNDPRFSQWIDEAKNQKSLGWALASAVVGYPIGEKEV